MRLIILIIINILLLIIPIDYLPKFDLDYLKMIVILEIFFIYMYTSFNAKSRRYILIFSSFVGIFLGSLIYKGIFVIQRGFKSQVGFFLGGVLLVFLLLEFKDSYNRKGKK